MSPLTATDVRHSLEEIEALAHCADLDDEMERQSMLWRLIAQVRNVRALLRYEQKENDSDVVRRAHDGEEVADLADAPASKGRPQ